MPNPDFPVNCPKCGAKLTYVRSEGEMHFYRCPRHATVVLPPHERIGADDERFHREVLSGKAHHALVAARSRVARSVNTIGGALSDGSLQVRSLPRSER